MKSAHIIKIFLLLALISLSGFTRLSRKDCRVFLTKDFISDEQEYKADFNEQNKAYFHSTFFGNTTYRIVACSDQTEIVKFSVSDHQGNLIFSNENYNYAPFWDFKFEHTVDCVITIELIDSSETNFDATALLLIGFKK